MYEIFSESIGYRCTAEQAVAAFVDMPGVNAALGFAAGTPHVILKQGRSCSELRKRDTRGRYVPTALDMQIFRAEGDRGRGRGSGSLCCRRP